VDGSEPLSYRWCFNGTNELAGETNAELNLINLQIFYQMLAVGLVLLIALFIEGLRVRYLQAAKAKGIKV